MRKWLAFGAVLLLAGCEAPYQEMGFAGGVSADQMDSTTFRITALGNGVTGADRIQDYALMKAAETTLAAGCDYFVIVSSADRSSTAVISTPATATSSTTFVGSTAFTNTTIDEGADIPVFKPGQSLFIRVFKGPVPQGMMNAHDAHEILRYLGPRVKVK